MSDEFESQESLLKNPQDPYDIKVKGRDPWAEHPAKKAASLLVLLGLFYLLTAGFIFAWATRGNQQGPGWLSVYMTGPEMVAGYSGLYAEFLDWQKGIFQPKTENPI